MFLLLFILMSHPPTQGKFGRSRTHLITYGVEIGSPQQEMPVVGRTLKIFSLLINMSCNVGRVTSPYKSFGIGYLHACILMNHDKKSFSSSSSVFFPFPLCIILTFTDHYWSPSCCGFRVGEHDRRLFLFRSLIKVVDHPCPQLFMQVLGTLFFL